jgi:hypothetical protein
VESLPILTPPVEDVATETTPLPFAFMERLSLEPLEIAATATPPAAAAPVMLIPVATLAVEASILMIGFVAPLAPTVNADALAEVTVVAAAPSVELQVTALVRVIAPVEVPPRVIVPLPLASIVKASLVPLEIAAKATPPAAAAPVTEIPVATLDVAELIFNTGFVAPLAPTVRAFAFATVSVAVPATLRAVSAKVSPSTVSLKALAHSVRSAFNLSIGS